MITHLKQFRDGMLVLLYALVSMWLVSLSSVLAGCLSAYHRRRWWLQLLQAF